jgi:TonB family protein
MFFLSLGISMLALTVIGQDAIPKQINGGVLNGKAIKLVKPAYPGEARSAGLAGTVYVSVVIDESGMVISAAAPTGSLTVKKSVGDQIVEVEVPAADPLLRDAAEKAALESRFSPTLLSGRPVKVAGTIIYNFVADSGSDETLNGKAISIPQPPYPEAAVAVRACGPVNVKVTVDGNGDVISASAVSGHPLLRAAAVKAARDAKFSPTLVDGKPVAITGNLIYRFGVSEDGKCSQ